MSEMREAVLLREATRFLPVELSPEEMQEKVSLVSHLFGLRDEMEVRHKEEKDRIKSEAERMATRIERESEIVRKKSEDQEVVVKTILYPSLARVVTVRADTGDEIGDGRPATQDELQRSFLEPAAKEGEENPFLDGQEDAHGGYVEGQNPHPEGSAAHAQWLAGWRSVLNSANGNPGNGETDGDD